MKGNVLAGLGLLAALAAVPGAALAHHSGAMFDRAKSVELKGTIKQFGWTNPHAYIAIDVPNAQGAAEEWSIECNSPSQLAAQGLKKSTLKPGDKVSLFIHPMKDGTKGGSFDSVVLASGERFNSGGSQAAAATATK